MKLCSIAVMIAEGVKSCKMCSATVFSFATLLFSDVPMAMVEAPWAMAEAAFIVPRTRLFRHYI